MSNLPVRRTWVRVTACSGEAGPKPPAPRTPRAPLPNCNYRRDLALALGVVGRTTTGERCPACALSRHWDVRARCTAWLNLAHGFVNSAHRWAVEPQPVASGAVVGARLGDETPVGRRMVHPAKVHQLVDQHVIPNRLRHQHQPPVQADVAVTPARTPPRALITNTDAADREPVACRQFEQPLGQLAPGLLSRCLLVLNRTRVCSRPSSLSGDPVDIALNERLGFTT